MVDLLIHSDNVPFADRFAQTIYFNPEHTEIDRYIHREILPKIAQSEADILFVRETLSRSYLELYGVRLAAHIRISEMLGKRRWMPIVILSNWDAAFLSRLNDEYDILHSKNIFVAPNHPETRDNYLQKRYTAFSEAGQTHTIERLRIHPPKDYLGRHDISNEWAMYQWAQMLDLSTETIDRNGDKLANLLYFKYLVAKNHLEAKSKTRIKQTKKSGSVLLIDDKWDAGWMDILDAYLQQQYTDIALQVLKGDYKNASIEAIAERLREMISGNLPDVVLLDLRLKESDNTLNTGKKSINKLSGIVLMEKIKKINPGIQIVMFTASGDSLILDELHRRGILGYVKKDAPGDRYEASKTSFKKLDTLIKKGIERSYLKPIWQIRKKLLNTPLLTDSKESNVYELRQEIEAVFDILNSNMPNAFVYAMLAIFKCIETINGMYIEEDYVHGKRYALWKANRKRIDTLDGMSLRQTNDGDYNLSAENKIRAIIDRKTTIKDTSLHDTIKRIVCSRNYAMHPIEKPSCRDHVVKKPGSADVLEWFGMLDTIVKGLKQ